MPSLQFNNHASYTIEAEDHALLVDPWLEGTAFNDGWSLLDASTSNAAIVERLGSIDKPLTIWYSHEHSDHFSLSFLKALKLAAFSEVRIAYQKTLDRRVVTHLRKAGWNVVELRPGEPLALGREMSLRVWPFYDSGDSYSLVTADGAQILNLNDCAVDTHEKCERVRTSLGEASGRLDLLLTQFGYANWIGNEADGAQRRDAAAEKIERIALQAKHLAPRTIVPFASFVRFCHEENAYMNDAQNTIDDLVESPRAQAFRDRVHVMQPGDRLDPTANAGSNEARAASERARVHWRAMADAPAALPLQQRAQVPLADLRVSADKFRSAISRNLAWTDRSVARGPASGGGLRRRSVAHSRRPRPDAARARATERRGARIL